MTGSLRTLYLRFTKALLTGEGGIPALAVVTAQRVPCPFSVRAGSHMPTPWSPRRHWVEERRGARWLPPPPRPGTLELAFRVPVTVAVPL